MKHLFLQPHNDDAVLFGSFTIQRHLKQMYVLTVFDSYVQGDNTELRRSEDFRAIHNELGSNVGWCDGLRDDRGHSDEQVKDTIYYSLSESYQTVWAPAIYAEGHAQHNQVGRVASMLGAPTVRYYHSYVRRVEGKVEKLERYHRGAHGITLKQRYGETVHIEESKPEKLEHVRAKLLALACYKSQIERRDNFEHFLRDQREWVVPA